MREYRVAKVGELDLSLRTTKVSEQHLKELRANIERNGVLTPILVDPNMTVIDGMRRLSLLEPDDVVDIVVAHRYQDAMDILIADRGGDHQQDFTPQRFWDLYNTTRFLNKRYVSETRMKGWQTHLHKKPPTKLPPGSSGYQRDSWFAATGLSYHRLQVYQFFYMRLHGHVAEPEERMPFIRKAVKDLENGRQVETVYKEWRKAILPPLSLVTATDQRRALLASMSSLNAAVRALSDLDRIHEGISVDEAREFSTELSKVRTAIRKAVSKLNERTKR